MEGTTLGGRYEVLRHLARGGMADIYVAHDRTLDREVVVKALRTEHLTDDSSLERLRREALAVARLQHPGIVHVYDFVQEGDAAVVVMEYVEGRTLSDVLREDGPLPAGEVARIGASVAGALAYAHERGVIHRDTKPSNIILTAAGAPKVTDFGIARAAGDPTITQTGLVIGTPAYLSPEQLTGGPVDARTDVYSLGVVLYEACSGQRPFDGDTPEASAHQRLFRPPVPPTTLRPDLPAPLEDVILKAMSGDADDRFPSAHAMGSALEALSGLGGLGELGGLGGLGELAFRGAQTAQGTAGEVETVTDASAVGDTDVLDPALVAPTSEQVSDDQPTTIDRRSGPGKPWPKSRWYALAAALVIAALAVAVWRWPTSETPTVMVPEVMGMTLEDAAATLVADGLRVEVAPLSPEPHSAAVVIAQDPASGAEANEGDTVTLVVAAPAPEDPPPPEPGEDDDPDDEDLAEAGHPDGAEREYAAADAGTVRVARDGNELEVTGVSPRPGWSFEVDKARGKEVKVEFERGQREVEFRARFDDGEVRVEVNDGRDG